MRAKFIYEKFTEDSDPIHDMGIGMPQVIQKSKQKIEQYFCKYDFAYEQNDFDKDWRLLSSIHSDKNSLRGLDLQKNKLFIGFYSNRFRDIKTKKVLNKVEFAKKALKYAEILDCFKPNVTKKRTDTNKILNNYTCDAVIFKLKPEFIELFNENFNKKTFEKI